MNMSTPEIEELKKYIQKKFGKQLKTTTDFEEFSLHIGKTDSSVSASTLKRLFGYVGDFTQTACADSQSACEIYWSLRFRHVRGMA